MRRKLTLVLAGILAVAAIMTANSGAAQAEPMANVTPVVTEYGCEDGSFTITVSVRNLGGTARGVRLDGFVGRFTYSRFLPVLDVREWRDVVVKVPERGWAPMGHVVHGFPDSDPFNNTYIGVFSGVRILPC